MCTRTHTHTPHIVASMSWLLWISVTMNAEVHISFWTMVFSGYVLGSVTIESHGNSVFNVRNLHTFSTLAAPIYIPASSIRGLPFAPHPLQHLLFVNFFYDGHPEWCEVIFHFGFGLHFSVMLRIFSHAYWPSICKSSEKCLLTVFAYFFIWLTFWYWAVWVVCILQD